MNRSILAAATALLALAACSGGNEKGKSTAAPSNEEVAAKAAAMPKLQPGEYEVTSKLLEFTMAGVPQSQLDTMKSAMTANAEAPHRFCLTAKDAAEGPKQMVTQMREGNCRVARFDTTANGVSGEMQCTMERGATSSSKFDGTFTGDSSSMTVEADQNVPGMGGNGMHMKMRIDSHRIGECSS